MSAPLHRIIYFSRNLVRGEQDLEAAVKDILAKARMRNADVGVTGALLFNSGGFAQVLEGEIEPVNEIFERIQCDRHHADIVVLENGAAPTRMFSNWAMAFIGDYERTERLFGAISEDSGFDSRSLDALRVSEIMLKLLLREESAVMRETKQRMHSQPGAAQGRFTSRFKPGKNILVFHEGELMSVLDISEAGCKIADAGGRFLAEQTYSFDLVFQDSADVSGWRVKASCRWASCAEAGFEFLLDHLGHSIGNRIARQHLRGRLKVLNGVEL